MLIIFSGAFWPSVLEKCLFGYFTHFLMGCLFVCFDSELHEVFVYFGD